MLRTILAVLFAVCYLILGIPVLFVEWLIGKKNPHLRDISSLRMVIELYEKDILVSVS